jgi:hypothetical protein
MAITPNSFYTPGVDPAHPNFPGSELWDSMTDDNRRGYFGNFLGNQGLMGLDNKSQFAQGLYDQFHAGFQAEQFNKPNIDWVSYLQSRQGDIDKLYSGRSLEQKGVRSSQFGGSSQWLQR